LKTLNGHVDADVTGGALEGVDLDFELERAEALIERATAPLADTHRTHFEVLKTSAEIRSGIAETKDLTISSPALKVTGEGTVNLAAQTLDLHVLADTLKSLQGVQVQIPVKVTGRLSDPTVRPDVEALAKGQLRQKIKDVLHDKLQSLFGRP
jgi:AsmA protein